MIASFGGVESGTDQKYLLKILCIILFVIYIKNRLNARKIFADLKVQLRVWVDLLTGRLID